MADASEHLESDNSIPRVKLVQKFETGIKIKQIVFLESALSYILFSETGEVYLIENGQENIKKLEGRCSPNQLRALYASSRHSLVLQNGDKLLVRRDQNGVFLLQKAFVENVIESGNASIEIPVQEIVEWQKFFATDIGRNGINECVELRKLEEIMKNTMQEHHAKGLKTLTAILIIPKIHEFFPNLESVVFKFLKLKCNVYPVFPLVFWLLERIRWTLDREKPYHLLGNKNNKGRTVDVSVMNIEAARVLSFYKWPHMNYKYALPYRMAETGFFFQPNSNGDDRVVCFSCSISLVLWEPNDEPLQEHERHHTSHCRFNEDLCNDNVPLDVTTACQPFALIPFDNESIVIASTMNASAEFFAVADASNNSVVRMFHLDSCPLEPWVLQFNFLRDLRFTLSHATEFSTENINQMSRITALSVAGRERIMNIDGDSDALAQLYIGAAIDKKAFKDLTLSSSSFVFVYKVSRHLKEKTEKPSQPPPPPKPLPLPGPPISITDIFSDSEPSSSALLHDPDDDVIDVDFWSHDDMMDDNFDPVAFKNKMQKKHRARHDELNPAAEIEYNPFKLKYAYLGLIELNFESGEDWVINNITTCDVDNGLVAVSAYSKEQDKSAVAHFARRSDCHRIEGNAIRYQYFAHEVTKLIVLPVDHFASFRVSYLTDHEPFGPNVILGNTLVLTAAKELFLLDGVSGKSVIIDSNVVDFIVDDKQNIMVGSENGEMKTIHVAASLTAMQSERIDEIALSMLSSLKYNQKPIIYEIAEKFPSHPSIKQVVELLQRLQINMPFTSEVLEAVYFLTKSRPVKSIATQTRVMNTKTAIAALESYLQHALGFQMTSPPHWTESVRSVQKAASTIDASISSHSQKSFKENSPIDDQPVPTRAWKFLPEKEKLKPAYVFKMAIIPGMPLSHINFKFIFASNSNGSPDAAFTIYRSKEPFTENSLNGMESSDLIPYCDNPLLLESECEKMLGPYRIDNCVNSDNTYSLIQISSTVILEALSAARLKEDWFTKPVFLYLLIDVSKRPSLAQQINSRTQLIAQAARSRSRSDKAKLSRVSGGYKKKFHPRKAFIAKNTKTSASKNVAAASSTCRLAIIKRKDASSRRQGESPIPPNEPKEGFMYIEEFSVTLYRCQKQPNGHEQLQRIVLQKDNQIHRKLVEIVLREDLSTVGVNTVSAIQKTQLQALDILIWITQGWRLSANYLSGVLELLEAFVKNYEKLFINGFATASCQIAQKWNTLLGQLLRTVNNQESVDCEALFTQLINLMKKSLLNDLGKIEKAGSLHWFMATVFTVAYESTYLLIEGTHITAANQLAETCIAVLKDIGDTFQKKWNSSMHQTLSTKYGLSGLIFELNLFDFPQQLLGYRTASETVSDNDKTNISSMFKQPQNPMINPITGYNPAAMGGYLSHINPPKREPPPKPVPSDGDGEAAVSGKLFPYSEHETLSLMEMLNLNIGYGDDTSIKQPWFTSVLSEGDWFDIDDKIPERTRIQTDLLSRFSWSRFAVGPEIMSGLMEFEPLSFGCIGPADYTEVYNCDTQSYSSISLTEGNLIVSSSKAPEVQRVIASIKNMDFDKTANYQLSNEILSVFKPPCDFVLSVDRVTANSKRQIILDFGGPTLLKSFIIPPSEYVQTIYVDGWWNSEGVDSIRIAQSKSIKNKALIVSNIQPGILIRKLKLTFIMKGTTGKARIPVGRYFGSKWLIESDISNACVPFTNSTGDPVTVSDICIELALAENLTRMMQYFCEEIRCRYNIAAAELKKLIEEGYSAVQVKEAYVLCYNLRLQWNISFNVMEKLQSINQPFIPKENLIQKDWSQLDMEHLKSLCLALLNFSNELTNVLDLRDSTREIMVQAASQLSLRENDEHSSTPISHVQPTQILTLETAKSFFDFYCTHNVPSIKALGCAQLFKNGCFTSWWGNMFPELLSKYFFVLDNNSIDNETFLVLSILCSHSVKHSHLQQTVMEKLFNFVIGICKDLMLPDADENSVNNNSSLLSWTLQLLSTSFDVIACNKRKTDRWSFLSGLFGQSSTYTPSIPTASDSSSARILSNFDQTSSTRDKILSRWKEVFNYDDFLTELEKPQFIARRLDILADRLLYLHALIREEFDGIPAVLPPKREEFSLPPSVESASNKASSPPLPDTSSTRLLIVPLHNLQSRVRVRQYSARLKISETLCLSVVQHLLELLLHEKSGRVFPYSSQLLAVKVISKISLHGSASSIPLTCALGEKLHDFVFKMLKASKEYEWMRYALLMLLVDLTDAEIRSFGRNASQRQMHPVIEDEIGTVAKRYKPDTEIEMSEENSINNEILSDQAMEDLTVPEADAFLDVIGPDGSATAIAAGVNDSPWAFVSPSKEFISFSNFDRIAPEQVDDYILRAAVAVLIGMKDANPQFLTPIPAKNITENTRFSILLQWYFRLSRYYCDRGEALTNIFRFFDEATIGEEEHYLKCNTTECYTTTYSLAVFENTRLGPCEESEKSDKSITAQAFISFCNNYLTDERKTAALVQLEKSSDNIPRDALELRFYQATIEAKYHLRLCGMRHLCREMQIGDVELQKAINGHMVRIRYKLPELTGMALDANGDKMISAEPDSLRAFDTFALNAVRNKLDLRNMLKNDKTSLEKVLNVYSKILFINVTWPEFEDFMKLTKHVFSEQTLVEMASAGETPPDLSSISQSSVEPIQPLDTAELKCALESLTNEVQMSTRIRQLNHAVHLQFSADLAVAGDNILVQPSEMIVNFLMDMQFGFQPFYEASYREQIRGTLARNCMYNFVPHCISTRKSGEPPESTSGLGQSVRAVVNVVNAFLTSLESDTSSETLLNVLTFYLEFTGYVHCITGACNSTKTILLEKGAFEPPPLSYDALFKLLHFVTVGNNINEEIWQNTLTTFTRNIRKDISNPLLSSTSTSFNLRQFLQKFFSDSLHAYGIGTSFGPTCLEHMGTLLSKLLASDVGNGNYLEQYIDCLSSLFADPSSSTFGALPIETLSAIIDIVGQSLKVVAKDNTFDVQKVSLLLYRIVQMIRVAFPRFDGYLRNCAVPGKPPGSSSTQLSQANMCFTSILPPSSMNLLPLIEIVPISSSFKLPELSFTASKSTSPETTSSAFRRAKNPAKMWQASNVAAMDPFEYEGFEGGFDSMRAYANEQVYEKPNVDRTEMLFILFIKFINTCSQLGPVWSISVQRYPQTLTVLINLLNECESAVDSVTEVNIEYWQPQTLADHLLYILLAASNGVGPDGDIAKRFMQVSLQTIFKAQNEKNEMLKISDPLIFALMKLNYQLQRKEIFVQLEGHHHIAEQLKKCLIHVNNRWPSRTNMFTIGQQLTNVANEVNGIVPQTFDVQNLPVKLINGSRVYNFSPASRINGHSINTSSLANILMDPIPHRRSRHAAYAYTFPQGELWTSVTISLPCQIMLYEIQVKCHQYSLNTPSAIQVELSSDVLPARHWALFGGNFVTAGLISTIIDTTRHQLPVGAIKLHLRRPNGYTGTINLSQILIYGIVTSPKMQVQAEQEKSLSNWLTLYDKFQTVQPSLWQYASTLPQKLMQLFISLSNEHKMYPLLRQVICNIDYRARSNESTVIELILKHVFAGGRLSDGISPVISAEMLYSFCTESEGITSQRAAIRHQQLLVGIERLLSLISVKTIFDDTTFSIILWSAACIVWSNLSNENLRYQTVATCLEVGSRIRQPLWNLAISTANNHKLLKSSAAWLLCSLFRADPNLARITTEELCKQAEFSKEELIALSKIYQSESAAIELINSGMFLKFVKESIKLSKEGIKNSFEIDNISTLVNYIEFLGDLSVIDAICVYLQQPECQELFNTLLPTLVYSNHAKNVKETLNIFANLDKATVRLCQRCIAYGNEHRKLISKILTKLLAEERTKFCGRIDGTLLNLIVRLVLEDEFITLRIKGLQGPNYGIESFPSRMVHPVFGCKSTDRIFSVSLFTALRDMVPLRQTELSKLKMTLAGMYDDMSTFDSFQNFMSSHKKKVVPEVEEPTELSDGVVCSELGQKQYVARLFCEQISSNESLNLKRNLKDIFYQTNVKDTVNYVTENDGKISNSKVSDFKTFGYLTLLMEVRITNRTDSVSPVSDVKSEIPSNDLTMLQHFALVGGFSQLSSHFPMADHYSSVLETYESLCKKQRESNTKSSHGPTAENASHPKPPKQSLNQVAFASQFQQQLGQVLGQVASTSSNLQAMIAGTPVSIGVLEPSSIVGFQNGDPSGALAVIPNNFPVTSSAGLNDNSYQAFGNALNYMINNSSNPSAGPLIVGGGFPGGQPIISKMAALSSLNSRQNLGNDKDVPAYTIFALSMFLKLDYYAITLVTCDRFQAKRVLRSAMGLTSNEREMSSIMTSFRPVMPKTSATSSPIIVNQLPERKIGCSHINGPGGAFLTQNRREIEKSKKETENLTIYPFYVLEKFWILSGPQQCSKEISSKIRFTADSQGILDVILLCTSRFSNTPPRWQITFPPSSAAQAIDQLFQLTDQIDTLRDTLNAAPMPTSMKHFQGMSMSSALMPQHEALIMGPQQHAGQQDFFPKGTGFGSGTTQVQWNLNEHVRRRKLSEEAVTCMLNIISGYLNPVSSNENGDNDVTKDIGLKIAQISYDKAANFHRELLTPENQIQFTFSILSKIYNSCLMPVIHSYLTNDSVFDISKHVAVFEACIWFVITVAALKPVEASENELKLLVEIPKSKDIFASMLMEEYRGTSVFNQMKKMHEMIKVYLSTIHKERKPEEKNISENEKSEDSQEEENLEALAVLLQKALIILEHRLNPHLAYVTEAMEVDNGTKDFASMSLEDIYVEAMKNIQYESVPFFKNDDSKIMEIPHHYSSTFLANTSTGNQKRWRRLAQETITLSSSLPLTASSSVFMRACEERLDVYKLVITGPPGTPYSNGCFEFDAFCPSDYPNVPLQISLQTTGGNTVRFNPNLYNDGKVCLSILNTWHGRPEERWNAETSSFLQVIVSIQSLILVNEPYFNEPGYERSRNTPAGQQASRDYDANIRNQTVRWAMLEQIRHPPKGFEEVIRRHFWIKRDEICEQIEEWISEMQKLVDTSTDPSIRVTKNSLTGLVKNFEDLKTEFAKMKAPEGLQKLVSKYFANNTDDISNEAAAAPSVKNEDETAKSQK